MAHVDSSQVTPLYNNTTPGVVADANVFDPAIAALIVAINENYDAFEAFKLSIELPIPDQSIVTRHLRNLAVTNPKLAPLAVTADKIANGAITLEKLADLVITAAKIANGTITEAKLSDSSVSRRTIIPGAVGANQIDPSILNAISDAGIQVKFNKIDEQLSDISINILNYGAIGGGADDTAAIQNAINDAVLQGVRKVLIPGVFQINSPLNLTNLLTNGITLEGTNTSFSYGVGSELVLNTGGVGIDCTGTSRMVFKNLKITSRKPGQTNPSKIGILFGRSTTNTVTGNCNIEDCIIDMVSDYTANSGIGTIAIYNYATEVFQINGGELKADLPLVFTQNNLYSITSPYTTINPPTGLNTMTVVNVIGTMLNSRRSYACVMENLGEAVFKVNTDCYPPSGSGLTRGIADFRLEGDFNKSINITEIHSELFVKLMDLNGQLDQFEITGTKAGLTDKGIDMLSATARLRRGIIRLYPSLASDYVGKCSLIHNSYSNDFNLNSLEIYLGSSTRIDAPNQRLTSSLIISTETIANTSIIVKAQTSTFNAICYDGNIVNGRKIINMNSVPTTGDYLQGDKIINNLFPSVGGTPSWTCTASGSPGTWQPDGIIGAKKLTSQSDSTATDVATLKTDFNALLAKLRTAGLM